MPDISAECRLLSKSEKTSLQIIVDLYREILYNIGKFIFGGLIMAEKVTGKYLEYKGKPLVREGDTICYGDKTDKCFLILEIMSYKKVGDVEIPDKIFIQIVDSENPSKIVKQGEKNGLYDAFGIGLIWLDMANK